MILDYCNLYDFPEGQKYYYIDIENFCIVKAAIVSHKLFRPRNDVVFYTELAEVRQAFLNACNEKIRIHQKQISMLSAAMATPVKDLLK